MTIITAYRLYLGQSHKYNLCFNGIYILYVSMVLCKGVKLIVVTDLHSKLSLVSLNTKCLHRAIIYI